jgi:hypothetical protein
MHISGGPRGAETHGGGGHDHAKTSGENSFEHNHFKDTVCGIFETLAFLHLYKFHSLISFS